jgi:hypothetical protein
MGGIYPQKKRKMVHRMLLVKVGGRYVHLLKMFGALFTFACAFYVLHSAFALSRAMDTASIAYPQIPLGDVFGMMTGPIASLFLWLGFMVVGLALYRSDRTILPLEEDITDYPQTVNAPAYKAKTRVSSKKELSKK